MTNGSKYGNGLLNTVVGVTVGGDVVVAAVAAAAAAAAAADSENVPEVVEAEGLACSSKRAVD